MNLSNPEFEYVQGQKRETFPALFASFEVRNAQALTLTGWQLDRAYGTHVREVFDFLPTTQPCRGTVVYFHAGYWQSRDKAQFRFLAPKFNVLGFHAALVNYPLCPEVTVMQIVASAARAVQAVAAGLSVQDRHHPLIAVGHSAGGHLVTELALLQASARGPAGLPLAGVLAISGVFDLRPLVETSLNTALQLDAKTAHACSPLLRVVGGASQAIFAVGGDETPAFRAQSQAMADAWRGAGNVSSCVEVAGADHFSLLDDWGEASFGARALWRLIGG